MLIALVVGVLQYIFWFVAWAKWLGVILGFLFTPGVAIFPIIYWVVEGEFPTLYFVLMFAGWFGLRLKRG